jgi:DNA polymerase-3 subunit alpha
MPKPFWSVHTHSRFSVNDALPRVEHIVERAAQLGYPALGLTDHGNIAGAVSLYTSCRKAGIEPLPGIELYVTDDAELKKQSNDHLTVVAYSEKGYRNLCKLATVASRKFYFRPRLDMADFAQLADAGRLDGLAVSTGCYFGVAVQRLVNRDEDACKKVIDYLAGCFPRTYVELQGHGIEKDEQMPEHEVQKALIDIAYQLGLPYVITQDSHYLNAEDRELHNMLKELVSWSDDVDDAVFPGDPYCMVDAKVLGNYFEPLVLNEALYGLDDLASVASVRIPELEVFSTKVPDVTLTGDAQGELESRCLDKLREMFPDGVAKPYAKRLEEELEVIEFAQCAGMLLLTAMVTDFMTKENIWFGARGSASGSLVCWLLGITQLDPVDRRLDFTRFLSKDRTKMPDIDLDVEHARRPEVGAMLSEHFSVAQVGTLMTYSVFDEEVVGDNVGGSLVKRYYTVRNKKGLPKIGWKDIPEDHKRALEALGKLELFSGYGKHAAGYVVAPDPATLSQLPLSYIASSSSEISAYYKKDVERLGFMKLDVLGLRDRTAFRITGNALGFTVQTEFEDSIPLDDADVFKRISKGQNEGVFQLQGFSMNKGCQRLQPKNLDDLADAQALFRPAATGSGATSDYMSRRHGRQKMPESRHDDIKAVTKETYGVLLYQEQMVEVLRRLGLPPDELTEMLDAVKASNKYSAGAKTAIEAMLPQIREFAGGRGWSDKDIQWLADALVAFAEYSFNRAHADKYALDAYRSAWLSLHHPVEFWLGLLTAYQDSSDKKKLPALTAAARRYGVKIRAPHVNTGQSGPTLDAQRVGIVKGLTSVSDIGPTRAAEIVRARGDHPFESLVDFGKRVNSKKISGAIALATGKHPLEAGGCVLKLYDAQAFEGLKGAS